MTLPHRCGSDQPLGIGGFCRDLISKELVFRMAILGIEANLADAVRFPRLVTAGKLCSYLRRASVSTTNASGDCHWNREARRA